MHSVFSEPIRYAAIMRARDYAMLLLEVGNWPCPFWKIVKPIGALGKWHLVLPLAWYRAMEKRMPVRINVKMQAISRKLTAKEKNTINIQKLSANHELFQPFESSFTQIQHRMFITILETISTTTELST